MGEAVALLAQYGSQATILAGGTDLVPKINYYELKPQTIVYVGRLGLDTVKQVGAALVIGAATPLAKIIDDPLLARAAPALVQAARQHSSCAIRTAATIGGNIANASPAADMVMPLLAMDAVLRLVSARGERCVDIKDFFVGPGRTRLAPDELIADIQIPPVSGTVTYLKLGKRKAQACSIVTTAVRLALDETGCREARIALGSMAPTPLRCTRAEAALTGRKLDPQLIALTAAAAVAEGSPIDDGRATAWYRREAGAALVARALTTAAGI